MAGSQYNIVLGTKVDTTSADKAINNLIKKASQKTFKINFDNKDFQESLKKADTTIKNVITSSGKLETTIKGLTNNGRKQTQIVTQQIDAYGNLKNIYEQYITCVSSKGTEYEKKRGKTVVETITQEDEIIRQLTKDYQVLNTNINTYTTSTGKLVTEEEKVYSNGVKLKTTTSEYINNLGVKNTETQKAIAIDGQYQNIGNQITTTLKGQSEVTDILTTKTQTLANGMKTLTTETISTNQAGEKTKTVVTETSDNLGKLTTTTSEYVQVQGQWVKQGQTVNTTIDKTNTGTKGLISTIITATQKVLLFSASTQLISLFSQAVSEAKQVILDFDAAITEMKKVSDLSGESLNNYTQRLGELGEAVGRTRTQMVEASTEFLKSGYSTDDSANLAQIASLYQNIADSELSAGDSASYIISQMKAFGIEANNAIDIIDKTNEVSNNFAVSSTDISSALTKTSSSLASYGNDINETIGLITAGTEIMTGQASKVGRGLRSIGVNITKMATQAGELSYSVNGTTKTISLLNDETGDMLNTYEVLSEIKKDWDDMNASEQATLATNIASKTQMDVFTSVMTNFDTAVKATNTSIKASGSAWKENEAYTESIAYKLQAIKTQFEALVLGDGGLTNVVKLVLDLTANFLTLLNSGDKLIITLGLLTTTWALFNSEMLKTKAIQISSFITKTISDIVGFIQIIMSATTVTEGFNSALALLGSTNVIILAITATLAGLYVGVKVLDKLIVTADESAEMLSNFASASSEADNNVETLTQKVRDLKDEIATLGNSDSARLQYLKEQTAEYEAQLAIEKEKQRITHSKEEDQAVEDAYTGQGTTKVGSFGSSGGIVTYTGTAQEQLQQSIEAITNYGEKVKEVDEEIIEVEDKLTKAREEGNAKSESYLLKSLDGLEKRKEGYQEQIDGAKEVASVMNDKVQSEINGIYSETGANAELKQSLQETSDAYVDILSIQESGLTTQESQNDLLESVAEKYGVTTEAIQDYLSNHSELYDEYESDEDLYNAVGEALQEQASDYTTLGDAMANSVSTIYELGSSYKSLKSAVDDFNNGGGMTASNLENLITLATEHAGALTYEGGQLQLNQAYFENLAQAEIDEAEAKVAETAQTQLASIQNGEYAEILEQVNTAANHSATGSINAGNAAYIAGENAAEGAKGFEKFWASVDNKDYDYNANQKKAYEFVKQQTQVQYEALEGLRSSLGTFFSDTSSASSSASKSTTDTWKEAYKNAKENIDAMYENGTLSAEEYVNKLQELSDKYLTDTAEHQEKYADEIRSIYNDMYKALKESAKDALDEEENRLKEAYNNIKEEGSKALKALKAKHEEEEDAVDKKIDALEKLKDKEKEAYNTQIDKLKKVKEQVEDTYDAQIDALKAEREEYENQLELMKLKQEIAQSSQEYQYVMGEDGKFGYQVNQEAVDTAQEELYEEELKQTYERQLQALEDAKAEASKSYEQQIEDLENFRDAKIAEYEQQIEDLEIYLDNLKEQNERLENELEAHYDELEAQYEKAYNDFKAYADKALEGQITVVENENSVWATRINNLANFVNQYNAILNKLGDGSTSNSGNYSGSSAKTTKVASNTKSSSSTKTTSKTTTKASGGGGTWRNTAYASGNSYVDNDQIAIVGEDPNKEIVIGSKLNNGVLANLTKGSGVVNATSTKTLAGLLNSLGTLGMGSLSNLTPNNTSNSQSITIGNITLPQVKDGQDFINYMQNFSVDMTTKAFAY